MYPPPDAVEALAQLHPTARLAWQGKDGPELNSGEFALLQLYHKTDAASTLREPWEDRGPVFGKPFLRDLYKAIWLANFTLEEIHSGAFIQKVKRWMTPIRTRMTESAIEVGKAQDARVADLAAEIGDDMWREGQKNPHGNAIVAQKFISKEDKAIAAGDVEVQSFVDDELPPPRAT